MTRRLCALWIRALLVGLLVLVGGACPLHAEPSEADVATARQLAKEGFAALDAKDFAEAEKLFDRARKLYDAPTLLLGLARARVGLGHFVEARENYQQLIRRKPDASNTAFQEAVESARTEVEGLEDQIAWVTIMVEGPDGESTEVTIDGTAIPAASLGVKRALNPGEHEVVASAAGYATRTESFSVDKAETLELNLELQTAPGEETQPATTAESSSLQQWLGIAAVGVGGAFLIAGVVTGAIASGEHGDLEDNCPDGQCPPAYHDTLDSFNTTSTVSTVGFIAGGVLAAAGTVLILTAPTEDSPDDTAISVGVGLGYLQTTVRF